MPLVSVVIATYNRAEYVSSAVESVLNQTFRDFELIVIDDGSTDDTAGVLEPFGGRIRYQYQDNAERGAARNHGLQLAAGKYISFLDSDDLWLPNKLKAEMERLQSDPTLGLVYSDALYIDSLGRPLGRVARRPRQGRVLHQIVCENFISLGAHLMDRQQFVEAGAFSEDRTLSGSEDWEAWVRMAARVPFGYVRNPGLLYRVHGDGTVAEPQRMRRAMLRACDLIFGNPDFTEQIAHLRPLTDAYVHLVVASLACAGGCPMEARLSLRRARESYAPAILDPRYLGMLLRLLVGRRAGLLLRMLKQVMVERGAIGALGTSVERL